MNGKTFWLALPLVVLVVFSHVSLAQSPRVAVQASTGGGPKGRSHALSDGFHLDEPGLQAMQVMRRCPR